jgi:hypothetical protein
VLATADEVIELGRALLRCMSPLLCRFLDAGNDETLGTLSWPASKKRQGTKSREVGHRRGNRRYGDLMPAQSSGVDATLSGCDLRVGMLARSRACNGLLGVRLERIDERSGH